MHQVLDESDERIAQMRRVANGEPEFGYVDVEEEGDEDEGIADAEAEIEQLGNAEAEAFTTREYTNLPALVAVYAGVPETIIAVCEEARGRLRAEYVHHLQVVRDALAPYAKFSEWCEAVGLSSNTVYSILRREEQRSRQPIVQLHNPSPGPDPSPDPNPSPNPKPHKRTDEERKAGPTAVFVARVRRLPLSGVDADMWKALAEARLDNDDEEGFNRMRDELTEADERAEKTVDAIRRLSVALAEAKKDFDRLGEVGRKSKRGKR